MQSALRLIFPPQCVSCGSLVDSEFTLCGDCWRQTPFINGNVCDQCGTPLAGEPCGTPEYCDDCLTIARPWAQGRAALLYRDNGRRLVLALKHGDRLDLAKPAARWLAAVGRPILQSGMVVVPVPAHWQRLLRRRYNQAAELARQMAAISGHDCCPDALFRSRKTAVQDGMGRDERFRNMSAAIRPNPRRKAILQGRAVVLVDDVMTSGATLAAATEACLVAGATHVCVLVLARVAKDT